MPSVYRTEFGSSVICGGKTYPVLSFQIVYPLSSLSQAVIQIPVGRPVTTGGPSTVVNVTELLDAPPFTAITVKLRSKETTKKEGVEALPEETTVFEGYLLGSPANLGIGNGQGYASVVLKAVGALSALDSVATTQSTITAVSLSNSANAINSVVKTQTDIIKATAPASLEKIVQLFPYEMVESIKSLAEIKIDASNTFLDRDLLITTATKALARINESQPGALHIPHYTRLSKGAQDLLRGSIRDYMNLVWHSIQREESYSVMDCIKDNMDAFKFRLVPRIFDDRLEPIFFTLAGKPYKHISADEYWRCEPMFERETKDATQGLVDTCILYDSNPSKDMSDLNAWKAGAGVASVSSELRKVGAERSGRQIVEPMPSWFGFLGADNMARQSLKPGFGIPDAMSLSAEGGAEEQSYNKAASEITDLGLADDIAMTVLSDNLFQERKLHFSGRLRLDIAPGSLLSIDVPGDKFEGGVAKLYGHVSSVIISVNGGSAEGSASTQFELVHVRTEKEHGALTLKEHPIYETAVNGMGLL